MGKAFSACHPLRHQCNSWAPKRALQLDPRRTPPERKGRGHHQPSSEPQSPGAAHKCRLRGPLRGLDPAQQDRESTSHHQVSHCRGIEACSDRSCISLSGCALTPGMQGPGGGWAGLTLAFCPAELWPRVPGRQVSVTVLLNGWTEDRSRHRPCHLRVMPASRWLLSPHL